MSNNIEKKISPLIKSQFPETYRIDGEDFIDFVKAYYQWMESPEPVVSLSSFYIPTVASSQIKTSSVYVYFTTAKTHGFTVGNKVTISGITGFYNHFRINSFYYSLNGDYTVEEVVNDTTFKVLLFHLTPGEKKVKNFGTSSSPITTGLSGAVAKNSSSSNPIYYSRRLLDNLDIDLTEKEFLLHIKEKYLKNIQFDTATNTKQLVKHSLDLYRSRGTERAINLFFKIIFGEDSEVYYPGKDVFRTSDAQWVIPTYLEVTHSQDNKLLINRQIVGVKSGATAFVESVVTRKIFGKFIDILYISLLNNTKDFITGEEVAPYNSDIEIAKIPTITGSLTKLTVLEGGEGFSIGEIVDIVEPGIGTQGKARVKALTTLTGAVEFTLVDGGWGYTTNAVQLISDHVLSIQNVHSVPVDSSFFFNIDTVIQPTATLMYEDLKYTNGSLDVASFTVGDILSTYSGAGAVLGQSRVLSITSTGDTTGTILVSTLSGNMASNTVYYNYGNVITANLASLGYEDTTAVGKGVGLSSNTTLNYVSTNGVFVVGQEIFQENLLGKETSNAIIKIVTKVGANGSLELTNTHGIFVSDYPFYTRGNTVTANVSTLGLHVGVIVLSTGQFVNNAGNYVYEPLYGTNGQVNFISSGDGAAFEIGSLTNLEDIVVTDLIKDYKDVYLNATDYGANLNFANVSTVLAEALNFETYTVGTVASLTGINPGINYNYAPFVTSYEEKVANYKKYDFVLTTNNATGPFIVGELITQLSTGAKGIVKSVNNNIVNVRRITFQDLFVDGRSTESIPEQQFNANAAVTGGLGAGGNNVIALDTASQYQAGDKIIYHVAAGNTALTNLSNNGTYFVEFANDTVIALANTSNVKVRSFNASTAVDGGSEFITISNNPFDDGTLVSYTTDAGNTDVSGLTSGNYYYIVNSNTSGIKLSSSLAGSPINITPGTSETGHKITKVNRIQLNKGLTQNGHSFSAVSYQIIGQASGFAADLTTIEYDVGSYAGFNDVITTKVNNAKGSVANLEVFDSGFGYRNLENANFVSLDGTRSGLTKIFSEKQGKSSGFYRTNSGFLSDNKYIYDGDFYQDFSYVIKTSIGENKYSDMLDKLLHTAGTKHFSSIVKRTVVSEPTTVAISELNIANGSSSITRYYV